MNGKRLQVLFISSWYPNRARPLLGIFVKRHAAAIAKLCDVASIYVYAADKMFIEESEEDNIYTIRAGYKRVSNNIPLYSQFLKFRRYFLAYKKVISIYKEKKGIPDIINLNVIFPAGLIATYLKRKWNVPYVITEHWTGYFPEDGRYNDWRMKFFARKSVKNASAVVTDSNALVKRMQELGLSNTYYSIPNVVDTNSYTIAKDRRHDQNFHFVHVSVLDEEQKNVSGILRAFALLHAKEKKSVFTIVGESSSKQKLMELTKQLKIEDVVKFVGQKTGEELVTIFQNADAFVLFSNYENLPCVMLETMCCGIPVIGTRVGDLPEYINSTNGILVDSHDEKQLSIAMEKMIKNRGKYNPSEIRASVVDKVNSETIAKQFVDVYNKVLNRS